MSLLHCVLVLLCVKYVTTQSAHTNCSYMEDNLFTCDYTAMTSSSDRPINYNSFSPEPQRLELTVIGILPYTGDNQIFSNTFDNIDTSAFDSNYPASLILDCYGDGILLYSRAFANMTHVQTFKIRNCLNHNIPAEAFAGFENIDHFRFEGGSIDSIDINAWSGLNVEKLMNDAHSIPRNLGFFEVLYTKFPSTTVPPGLLYNMKNLTAATLRGVGIDTMTSDVFSYNTKIKYIDISDNEFTSIPSGLFDNLNSLSEVRIENTHWQCSCSNNWFVDFFDKNNVILFGENICSNVNGYTVFKYYYENCVSDNPCEGATGFAIGNKCVSPFSVIIMAFAFAAAGMDIASLIIILRESKQFKANDKRRRQAIGRWNIIIETSLKNSNKQ